MPANNLIRKNEEGTFSHIYNKGVEQKIIFNDPEDYKVFLGFIKDYLSPPQDPDSIKQEFTVNGQLFRGTPHQPNNYFNKVELIAYSLKADHFHLVLEQKTVGSLESFIRSLCTRYSIYFNKKYYRSGALFAGPYKSAEIKDQSSLLYLTRFLHSGGGYSSYPEYLGQRETAWVKPEAVLIFLGQGRSGYKDFVEKYALDQQQYQLPQAITIDPEGQHLERIAPEKAPENYPPPAPAPAPVQAPTPILTPAPAVIAEPESVQIPAESSEKPPLAKNLKPHQRIPEILATGVIFALLLTIGITNIQVVGPNSPQPFVLGIATSKVSVSNSPQPSATPLILKTEEVKTPPIVVENTPVPVAKPKLMLTIKTIGGTKNFNIHQKPAVSSKTIGKAKSGQTFEYLSMDAGWYEVVLDDGSSGFISKEYIKIGETNN